MKTIRQKFDDLHTRRTIQLERSRSCAELTVPGLLPPVGFSQGDTMPDLFSSMPARGVMSLASRMVSAIYPLNQLPFFQHQLDMEYVPEGADTTDMEAALSRLDRRIMDKLSETNLRQELFVLFQHLIVMGDALLYQSDDYEFRVIRCDQYVLRRRPDGMVTEIIVREWVDPKAIPEEWTNVPERPGSPSSGGPSQEHEPMYTLLEKTQGTWRCDKEFRNVVVDTGEYDVCPYSPQTWSRVAGEDYGRSLVEENLGDIRSLEALSRALLEGAAANSEYRVGIRPGGVGTVKDLQESTNGDYIVAEQGDVWSFQLNNQVQLQTTANARDMLTRDLGRSFLLASASQPTGERVTATQIREIAAELDQALGGVFSGAARDIQIPIVRRTMILMTKDGFIDQQVMDMVGQDKILSLKVRTGLEALNREVENSLLIQWAQVVQQLPESQSYVNWLQFLHRFTASFGIESTGILKTQEELQQEQEASMQQQMQQQAGSQAIQSAGKIVENEASPV
jgi:hypothetical protein